MPPPSASLHPWRSPTRPHLQQLNKEKEMRRAWAAHDAQKQIFERRSDEFEQLSRMRSTLEGVCGDPAAHVGGDAKPLSRRQQLVGLRNELRSTIATVDAKLDEANNAVEEVHLALWLGR